MDRTNDGIIIYRNHAEKYLDEFLWNGAFGTAVPGILWVIGVAILIVTAFYIGSKKGN